jgi:hypothetical protein
VAGCGGPERVEGHGVSVLHEGDESEEGYERHESEEPHEEASHEERKELYEEEREEGHGEESNEGHEADQVGKGASVLRKRRRSNNTDGLSHW